MNTTPKIYVACLASYNNGINHGRWIDVDDPETAREAIREILDTSPTAGAEEWAIHDHEGFGGLCVGENDDIDELCHMANALGEHGDAYAAWVSHTGRCGVEEFEECYIGEFDELADYAYNLAYECHTEKELGPFAQYIDWEGVGIDLELGGDVWSAESGNGKVYVFLNN